MQNCTVRLSGFSLALSFNDELTPRPSIFIPLDSAEPPDINPVVWDSPSICLLFEDHSAFMVGYFHCALVTNGLSCLRGSLENVS